MPEARTFSALALIFCLLLVSCDAGSAGPDPAEEPLPDEVLVDLLTRGGQRGLNVFLQPASDDLSAIPQDPRNPLTEAKIALGQAVFHDTALGTRPVRPEGQGTYSCVTCHHADAGFQAGRRQAIGEGGSGWGRRGEARSPAYPMGEVDVQSIRTPSVLNGAYQDVMHWDGSLGARGQNEGTEAYWTGSNSVNHLGYDGLETQAIRAMTAHRMDRLDGSVLETNPTYRILWMDAFGNEPLTVERVGLAVAAWERTVFASRAPFQEWLRGNRQAMSPEEKAGAILFFGKAGCETCHTGPALAGPGFYALGMADLEGADVLGSGPPQRGRGGFIADPEWDARFKIPQLYNLADSPFYGHGATFSSLRAVVDYYNEALPQRPPPPGRSLESRFRPLELTAAEVEQLTAFLASALRDPDLRRYQPASVPSGSCFPANDAQARLDLGCD